MGSMSGVDHTFDKIHDSYKLYFTECNYTENKAMKLNNPKDHMFTLEYYVKRNEVHIEDVIIQIIEDNRVIYREYKLNNLRVVYSIDNRYIVYCGEEVISTVEVIKDGCLRNLFSNGIETNWKKSYNKEDNVMLKRKYRSLCAIILSICFIVLQV